MGNLISPRRPKVGDIIQSYRRHYPANRFSGVPRIENYERTFKVEEVMVDQPAEANPDGFDIIVAAGNDAQGRWSAVEVDYDEWDFAEEPTWATS